MFKNSQVMATVPSRDLQRSRSFYEGVLGLTPVQPESPGGMVYIAGQGSQFYVYETTSSGGEATRIAFMSDDFDGDVTEIQSKGVVLEDYELSEIQQSAVDTSTVTKIAPGIFADPSWGKACWFKDPDGNIINLVESEAAAKKAAA